jgi:hypothetical protein
MVEDGSVITLVALAETDSTIVEDDSVTTTELLLTVSTIVNSLLIA